MLLDKWKSSKSNFKYIVPPVLLILCNIFIFGPATLYSGNISEFNVSLVDMAKYYVLPGITLMLILTGLGLFVSKKYLSLYISLMCTIGVLLWVQGNFFVWEYRLLDGQAIDWTKKAWRGWVDGTLWIVLLVMACLLHKKVYKKAALLSLLVVSLQFMYLSFVCISNREMWKETKGFPFHSAPDAIYQFSSEKNVIHVVMDAFQSDLFHEIIDQDPEHYKNSLDGFTFFEETTGAFTTTYMSIPAFLSGQIYKNDIPMKEFVKRTLDGKTISNVLYDNDYAVDLVPIGKLYLHGHFTNAFFIPVPFGRTSDQFGLSKAIQLMDLVLFRHTPHLLKRFIYNEQLWQLRRLFRPNDGLEFVQLSHRAFFDNLISNMSVTRQRSVYKFIHLVTTHPPNVMSEACEYAGKVLPYTRKNWIIQDKCALKQFIRFLDKLKSMGVYDSSLIILHSDTGAGLPVKRRGRDICRECSSKRVGSALPLLAIKPPHSKGPLKISNAPAMVSDIPATISLVLDLGEDFPGESVFEMEPVEKRERKYYHYRWPEANWQGDYFRYLEEYIIKGSVFDCNSWELVGIKVSPSKQNSFRTTKLDFGTDDASGFLLSGWGGNEKSAKKEYTYSWGLGRSTAVALSLPKGSIQMTANLRPFVFNQPQHITIKVDGKQIGFWNLANTRAWEKYTVTIPPDQSRPDVSVVEFAFAKWREPRGEAKRPLSVLFESITLSEVKDTSQ